MIKRILAALFGAVVFSILIPLAWFLVFTSFPFEGVTGIAALVGAGGFIGVFLGCLFPKVFGFVFEAFFEDL